MAQVSVAHDDAAADDTDDPYDAYTVQPGENPEWSDEIEELRDSLTSLGVSERETHRQMALRLLELRNEQLAEVRSVFDAESLERERVYREETEPVFRRIAEKVERLDLKALMLEDDEPIEWIWGDGDQGYIEAGSVGCFHGFGGTGKSMVMQALTRAITAGDDLLGMPCKRGRVLIIDAENPRREIKRRVKRLGLDPTRTAYLRTSAPILAPGFSVWVENEIRIHRADFLVLDSQRGLWAGDEKEAADVRPFYTELRGVAERTGCAIVVIHHDNKGLTFSGSTDIDAAVDFRMHMTRDLKDKKVRFLDQAKMRGADELEKIEVVIRFEGARLYVEKGERTPSGAGSTVKKASPEDIAMFIRRRPNQTATPSDIRLNFSVSDATLRKRRSELERLGIRYWEGGQNSVYHVAPNPRSAAEVPPALRGELRGSPGAPEPDPYYVKGSGFGAHRAPQLDDDQEMNA